MKFSTAAMGRAIRALRQERQLSQEVLSGLAGIARTHLSMIEKGDKQVTFKTLWKLADALDMRPSQLVERIEQECRDQ